MMRDSKKELIKKFLLEGSREEKKEKFEIAWDIWETFKDIRKDISKELIFKSLNRKIEELIEEPYRITHIDWGSIYVAKPEWKQTEEDRGIYALCVEKWDREQPYIGIVRNKEFTTSIERKIGEILLPKGFERNSWFLAYIPLSDWKYRNLKDYYLTALSNSDIIVGFIFNYFEKVYRTVRETEGLEELLDRSVEERKSQIAGFGTGN